MHDRKRLTSITAGIFIFILLLAAGCAAPVHTIPLEQQEELFLPATVAVSPAPTLTMTAALPRPTPTIACDSDLKFIADVTIPDGLQVEPGAAVDKRWEVDNTGSCHWDERFSLVRIEGPDLSVDAKQALFPARSGTQATLQIIFYAPAEPGTYRSVWQAAGPDGSLFGDRFYVEFVVKDS
jgi:hypothetical protein